MDALDFGLQLSRLVATGDRRGAATLLVERYASDVYATCRAMVRDSATAEDLAQDAFARAIAGLAEFRNDSSPRTWLIAIARHRCLDHLARARRAPIDPWSDVEPDDAPAEERSVIDRLTHREDAEAALGALGENERAIVVLHFGHGVGYPELAEAFGLKEGALRMRMSRALAKMRDALREEGVARSERAAPAPFGAAAPARARHVPPPQAAPPPAARSTSWMPNVLRRRAPVASEAVPSFEAPASASLHDDASSALLTRLRAMAASA